MSSQNTTHSKPVPMMIDLNTNDQSEISESSPDRSLAPHSSCQRQTLSIDWIVSREAFKSFNIKSSTHSIILRFSIEHSIDQSQSDSFTWTLIDPKSNESKLIPNSIDFDQDPPRMNSSENTLTIDSSWIHAIINRSDDGHTKLMFVRTTIFESLNIQGGRYKPDKAQIS